MTTREQIIAAAKEARIFKRRTPVGTTEMFCYESNIERFYATAFEAGRVAEREEANRRPLPDNTAPYIRAWEPKK